MAKNWDSYGRMGLDIAHSALTFGFSAAKVSTRLGVSPICSFLLQLQWGSTHDQCDLVFCCKEPSYGYR